MKSQETANRTFHHTCNRSTAKYQYSFGREQRFNRRANSANTLDKFYEVPSQILKRGAVFSRAKRDLQKEQKIEGPPPGEYNPTAVSTLHQVVFAPGREQCKIASIFYNTTISYPGPCNYDPAKPRTASHYSIAGKVPTNYSTISPGPKYNFDSTLLDRNKVLSNQKRTGTARIVLPTSKSRTKTDMTDSKVSYQSAKSGVVTRKGGRQFGQSGYRTVMTQQQRFKQDQAKDATPGPGQYSSFSDFIQDHKR